jgi:phosphoribosyl-ATP pyrophosphohydrolase/phosphoribosyl-AMP cyclohydrolase
MSDKPLDFLEELERIIGERGRTGSAETSYTAALFAAGASRIAQKVGEEAVELALASVTGERPRILSESADLLYHALVLLRFHDVSLAEVVAELRQRHR